jgi:hypothetical protein
MAGVEEKQKPVRLICCNKHMGGADEKDQLLEMYIVREK